MNNNNLTREQIEDILHMKFNETLFKLINVMKRHTVKFAGVTYSATEIHLIDTIGRHPDANVTELANHQGVTKSAISQKLKKLEQHNFIKRSHYPDNAKEIKVELTDLGWKAFEMHMAYHKKYDKGIFEYLSSASPENLKFLIEGFEMMNTVMDEHLKIDQIVLDLEDLMAEDKDRI